MLIDGIDVRDYTKASLLKAIGFVLQDTVLFRRTTRENVAYGRPDATDTDIVEAATLANAHDFISAMPRGYDALVGERGLTLRSGKSENEESRMTLVAAGIEVRDSTPVFALTRQTSMVIDETTGFVESLNWETRDLTETRDYAVVTTHKIEVEEMLKCFHADSAHRTFDPDPHSRLIWCPNNGRERIAEFIDSAKDTLWLQNERYRDSVVVERLVRAVKRGVPRAHHGAAAAHVEEGQAR